MPVIVSVICLCDTCGGPVGDTKQVTEYKNSDPVIDLTMKLEKVMKKLAKFNKAKIAKTSGRVTCKDCIPIANKSPKWSKG